MHGQAGFAPFFRFSDGYFGSFQLSQCGSVSSSNVDREYCPPIPRGATVECVHSCVDRTITFIVDGVNHGVAFRDIPSAPMYATVMLHEQQSVDLPQE